MKSEKKEEVKKAVESYQKLVKETLEKIEYKEVDKDRYSFKFKDQVFIFRDVMKTWFGQVAGQE